MLGFKRRSIGRKAEWIVDTDSAIEVTSRIYPVSTPQREFNCVSNTETVKSAKTHHRDAVNNTYYSSYESSISESRESSYIPSASSDHETDTNSSSYSDSDVGLCTMLLPTSLPQVETIVATWRDLREQISPKLDQLQISHRVNAMKMHIPMPHDLVATWKDRHEHIRPKLDKLQDPHRSNTLQIDDDGSSNNHITRQRNRSLQNNKNASPNRTSAPQQATKKPVFEANIRAVSQMIIQTQSSLSEIIPHSYDAKTHPLFEKREKVIYTTHENDEKFMDAIKPTSYSSSIPVKQTIARKKSKFDTNAAGKTLEYFPEKGYATSSTTKRIIQSRNQQDIHSRNEPLHHWRTQLVNHYPYDTRDDISKSSLMTSPVKRYSYPYLEKEDALYGRVNIRK